MPSATWDASSSAIQLISDTRQWLAFAVIREGANLVELDAGQGERAISAFSFDLTLCQAQRLNDPPEEQFNKFHPEIL
jgi:hypothetical protein